MRFEVGQVGVLAVLQQAGLYLGLRRPDRFGVVEALRCDPWTQFVSDLGQQPADAVHELGQVLVGYAPASRRRSTRCEPKPPLLYGFRRH